MDAPIYNRMMRNFSDLRSLREKLVFNSHLSPLIWNGTLNRSYGEVHN